MTLETKFARIDAEVAEDGTIAGYASRFGVEDQGGDIVVKGAYKKSLQSGLVPKMLWQHYASEPIGVWTKVYEDEVGLRVEGKINLDLVKGREVYSLLKSGAIDGLSIGYATVKAVNRSGGGRYLNDLKLWEVSLVTFPMQLEAGVDDVKSLDEITKPHQAKRIVERALRDAGYSARGQKQIVSLLSQKEGVRDAASDLADEIRELMRPTA